MKVLNRIFRSKKFHRATTLAKETKGTAIDPGTASVMDYKNKKSLFSILSMGNGKQKKKSKVTGDEVVTPTVEKMTDSPGGGVSRSTAFSSVSSVDE